MMLEDGRDVVEARRHVTELIVGAIAKIGPVRANNKKTSAPVLNYMQKISREKFSSVPVERSHQTASPDKIVNPYGIKNAP